MNTARVDSGLRYAESGEDVRLGDRVEFQSLFLRRRRFGTVVCIPAMTGRERLAQRKEPEDWLIKLDSGVFTGWLYSPEDLQPPRRLRLVSRATEPGVEVTNEELERLEELEEAKAGWLELAALPLLLLLLLLLAVGGAIWAFGVGT